MSERSTRTVVRDGAHSAVVPGNRVVRSAELAYIGGRPLVAPSGPTVSLVKDSDVVRAIDVTCACGKTMRLWLSYETPGEHQTSLEQS